MTSVAGFADDATFEIVSVTRRAGGQIIVVRLYEDTMKIWRSHCHPSYRMNICLRLHWRQGVILQFAAGTQHQSENNYDDG